MTSSGSKALRLEDERSRRIARTVFDRPLVLEAGAGTGKTGALVGRTVFWCLGPGWDKAAKELSSGAPPGEVAARVLERVLAITFTDRAAAEMEGRIAEAFSLLLEGAAAEGVPREEIPLPSEALIARAGALLGNLDRLFAGTIHSFCRRVLALYAIEAGLKPGFEVDAGELLTRAVAEDVVAARLREAYGDPGEADFVTLLAEGIGPAQIAQTLETLARGPLPPEALRADPYSIEKTARKRGEILDLSRQVLEILAPALGGAKGRVENAQAALSALRDLSARLPGAKDADQLAALFAGESLSKGLARLADWGKGAFTQAEEKAFSPARGALLVLCERFSRQAAHLGRVNPRVLPAACRVLAPLLDEVRRRMRARGVETFEALLRDTRALLGSNEEARRRLQAAYDQILVDEVQDTDPLQYDILRFLALDASAPARPGLFLIGDPKQSIYGWRQADLGAYAGFLEEVARAGGEKHSLCVNFRSVPAILAEVSRIISPVMREEEGVQPPFEELLPSPDLEKEGGFARGGRAPVEYWVSWAAEDEAPGGKPSGARVKTGPGTGAERAREIEAAAIARDIAELHGAHGVCWRDIAVLHRASTRFDPYLDALREAGVPFLVEGDRNYYRRREVIDAGALVRAVIDPNDPVALLTFLRSPAVGVPDAALLPLWRADFPLAAGRLRGPQADILGELDSIVRSAKRALPPGIVGLERVAGWEESLRAAVRSLAALRKSFALDPADVFVNKLKAYSLIEETEAARYRGAHRLANLDRFFRRLLSALASEEGGPQAVLRELRRQVQDAGEEEEGNPGDAAIEAVRVLTIHKAKGLTFKHVYVAGLHARSGGDRSTLADQVHRWKEGWEFALFGAPTLALCDVHMARERAEAAEQVRVLYVALTRPRERLVLAGKWPWGVQPPTPLEAASPLDLLLHRGGVPPLEEAFRTCSKERFAVQDAYGVLWKFPAFFPDGGAGAGLPEEGLSLPDPARALAEWEDLRERRAKAEALQRRPLTASPSGRAHEHFRPALDVEGALSSEVAKAVGKAVHQVFENFKLESSAEEELLRQRGILREYLAPLLAPELLDRALGEAHAVLENFGRSPLARRWKDIARCVLARELPFVRRGLEEDGPAGAWMGVIDLLYRDPQSGETVVADYKTDRVASEEEIQKMAGVYAKQGEIYTLAVQEALALPRRPRFELWFLRPGRIVTTGE